MNINTKVIISLHIWVQFANLDIKHWGMERFNKIESLLCILIKTIWYTKDKPML